MKIAITGSNGFLGQYFKSFTKLNQNDMFFLTTSKPKDGQLHCKPLYEDIERVFAGKEIDVIIHFAAVIPTSFSNTDYELFLKNNKMMNYLYEFTISNKLKKFIYLSSFGSMHNPKLLDIKDFYTMSKITGEHFCAMMEANNVQTASLRISAPYGEYAMARSVLNIFIEKAIKNETIEIFGSGKREQNFTYAGDIVKSIELSLEHTVSGIYDIVSKRNTSMLELAKMIIKITHSSSRIISGNSIDPQENYSPKYNYIKAEKELCYEPVYTLEKGLTRYIKWLSR